MSEPVKDYLKKIERELQSGSATEHSHRPHLKSLIESFNKAILAINDPKRVKCGAPDYIIVKGQTPLGYIEAKDIGTSLSTEENSEQMTRYRSSLSNLILTDYLEFRWYMSGEHRLTVRIGETSLNKVKADRSGIKKFLEMVNAFLNAQVPTVGTPKELAERMAALARLIRDTIRGALSDEDKGGALKDQMEGFREVLLHDLTEEDFADMYAQSMCYGLFTARYNSDPSMGFTRKHAAYDLPKTNPFLKKMFSYIAGPDLDDRIVWIMDDLAELLHRCDMNSILQNFGKLTLKEDPVVHFYETFLSVYDPEMRQLRGVYYTPPPVVSYIVRSIDRILKKDFDLPAGVADSSKIEVETSTEKKKSEFHKVQILDPACGTGTFLYGIADQIHESFGFNEGMWSGYVSEHLLPRLWGFELLMAPYAVAHMKLGLQLRESGYDFKTDERLGIYLTNTLEQTHDISSLLPFTRWIADEANAARKVKTEVPIMVILGNPPYKVASVNKGDHIEKLMESYKVAVRDQQNIQPLSDDYIKFIRFMQDRIERTGHGIVGIITNNGYLSGLIHRGMRQELLKAFTSIYILNLSGKAAEANTTIVGTRNENVFDIKQGVCIGVFVKKHGGGPAEQIHFGNLWGTRKGKYQYLAENDVYTVNWQTLLPTSPNFFFRPQVTDRKDEYQENISLLDIFLFTQNPVQTGHDSFAVDFQQDELQKRVAEFCNPQIPVEEIRDKYQLRDMAGWSLGAERETAVEEGMDILRFVPYLYRPFDWRWIYYTKRMIKRPVREIMRHMFCRENIALITNKQVPSNEFRHSLVSNCLTDLHLLETAHANPFIFPLYLYPAPDERYSRSTFIAQIQNDVLRSGRVAARDVEGQRNRLEQIVTQLFGKRNYARFPNLRPDFLMKTGVTLGLAFITDGAGNLTSSFGPEDIFHYIYAVLHSPTYRDRYADFLKIDFPRVPLTSQPALFESLCSIGKELIELHLLRKDSPRMTTYPIQGDHLVERVRYAKPSQEDNEGRVWINRTQYFKGVPSEVWTFRVGGHQVCQKWLKDRKGRKLSFDELVLYEKTVSALSETIRYMAEIDSVIEEHGGFPIE